MMFAKSRETDLTSGPLMSKLLLYSLPLLLTGILQLLFNSADIIVVGRYAGKGALAAVGATASLTSLLVKVFMMTSVGANVVIANHYGAGDHDEVNKTLSTAMSMSIVLGIFVAAIGILFAKPLLKATNVPEDVLDRAVLYMRIYFAGMPAFMIYNFGAAAIRAVGDTRRPLMFLAISGIINVILNLITVIVLHMDVAGVAISTAISQYISAAFVLASLVNAGGSLHLDVRSLHIYGYKLKAILKVGMPAGFESLLYAISNVLIQASVNSFGSIAMAGNAAAQNVEGFICMAITSVQEVATSFTGQTIGARKYERINKVFWNCMALSLMVVGGWSAMGYFLSDKLIGIYNSSPEVIMWGSRRLMLMCATYLIIGFLDVMVGMMRGMGVSILPSFICMVGICVVRVVWIYTVFSANRTYEVLLTSYPVSWILTIIAQAICYILVKRRIVDAKLTLH